MDEKCLRTAIAKLLADGATQAELAEKAGVRQNTISRFVNGLTHLRFPTALKLMRVVLADQPAPTSTPSMDGEEPAGEEKHV